MHLINWLLCAALLVLALKAPAQVEKVADQLPSDKANKPGLQTGVAGWVIRPGDTLQLGEGSRPGKVFTYLYQQRGSWPVSVPSRRLLSGENSGTKIILKELVLVPGKPPYGVVSTGKVPYYYAELTNAINKGEIMPPIQYRPSAQSSPGIPVVVARALIKLQAQLDSGLINQEQFNQQKKQLLDHQ